MRILHLVHDVRDAGNGIVHAAIDVATFQRAAGHVVAVASGAGPFSNLLRESGVEWFELPLRRSPVNMARAGPKFRSIVAAFKPDIVHAHVLAGVVIARLFRFRSSFRIVATAHRVYDGDVRLLTLADEVIALSASNADALADRGVPRKKLCVVKNGTIGSLRRPLHTDFADVNLSRPAIVSIAGLYFRKGIDTLIEAFALVARAHENAHLYLVGEGPDRKTFESQADALGLSAKIHFVGFNKRPDPFYGSADVFVLASRRESFPLVLLEAREAGCAIVATDVDGAREALDNGRAGILVTVGDAADMARAILLILNDEKTSESLRFAARTELSEFTVERMAKETLNVYGLP